MTPNNIIAPRANIIPKRKNPQRPVYAEENPLISFPCRISVLRFIPCKESITEAHVLGALKVLSYLIVLLMAIAVIYAAYMSVTYWTGIGV